MVRNDFEGLYQIYLRCFTDKLLLQVRGYASRYQVGSINKKSGLISVKTPDGFIFTHYRNVIFPDFRELFGDESVQSLADRINRGERIYKDK